MSDAQYQPQKIETEWQQRWAETGAFVAEETGDNPYYVLEMFPYPSGKIHMGHVRNYSIGDAVARFLRRRGHQVLHPIGWDAFGMPAENAAIKHNSHPETWTYSNIKDMRSQFKRLGLSYDWDRELATCHPGYFRWEQKIFLEMLEKGIAFRSKQRVNWCGPCGTVLANEQVVDGGCWRCSRWSSSATSRPGASVSPTMRRSCSTTSTPWSSGPTPCAPCSAIDRAKRRRSDRLARDRCQDLGSVEVLRRARHLHGLHVHELGAGASAGDGARRRGGKDAEVSAFVAEMDGLTAASVATAPRSAACLPGCTPSNSLLDRKLPIYVANFVLMDYGTGAVMAVPAHDQRGFEFGKRTGSTSSR